MSSVFALDQVRRVSARKLPVDPAGIVALAQELGSSLPQGYAETLAQFGQSNAARFGAGFCGLLEVHAPDALRARLAEVRTHAAFSGPYWPDIDGLFTAEDRTQLVPVATSIDAELLAFVSGVPDALFYFPNPGSGQPIDLVGETLIEALGWYARRHGARHPFFNPGVEQTLLELHAWDEPAGSVKLRRADSDPEDDEDDEPGAPFDTLAAALAPDFYDEEGVFGRTLLVNRAGAMISGDGTWRPGERQRLLVWHDQSASGFGGEVQDALDVAGWKSSRTLVT